MKPEDLRKWIDGLTQDISFEYLGIGGSICPFNRQDIAVAYGDDTMDCTSIDEVMNTPFIAGKPLQDICQDIEFE